MGARNDKGMMVDIFYGHNVVGNNTYSKHKNGREDIVVPYVTTYAVPLQRVHEHIRLYKQNNYMNVQVIIYV